MIQQTLSAYSQVKLLTDVARLKRLGWKPIGELYKEGLYWYQALVKQ
jgi:hypothetical protein